MKIILSLLITLFLVACMPSTPVQSSIDKTCPETSALVQSDSDISLADKTTTEEEIPASSCAE